MVLNDLIVCLGCIIFVCIPQPKITRAGLALTAIYFGIKGLKDSHEEIYHAVIQEIIDESEIITVASSFEPEVIEPSNDNPQTQGEELAASYGIKLFNWKVINEKPNKYAHFIIVGGTGDGKTFSTKRIIPYLGGKAIICNPHDKPGDFEGFPSYCGGRNYGDWKQPLPPAQDAGKFFKDFLERKIDFEPTVCQFIKILEREMNRRYDLYHQGDFSYEMVNIVLDEFCVASGKIAKGVEVVLDLIKEARKVLIRLFLLVKSDQVKTLKIEGQGDLRKSLAYVRLGSFAWEYAHKVGDSNLESWCENQEYPILIDKSPAILPNLGETAPIMVTSEVVDNSEKSEKFSTTKPTITKISEDEISDPEEIIDVSISPSNSENYNPTLEDIEKEILDFCSKGKTTVRKTKMKFSKYKLTEDSIWQIFQSFEEKKLGTIASEKRGTGVSRYFTPNKQVDDESAA